MYCLLEDTRLNWISDAFLKSKDFAKASGCCFFLHAQVCGNEMKREREQKETLKKEWKQTTMLKMLKNSKKYSEIILLSRDLKDVLVYVHV